MPFLVGLVKSFFFESTWNGGIGFKGYEKESQGERCIQETCMELRGVCVGELLFGTGFGRGRSSLQ